MQTIDRDTVKLTPWEQVISDEREHLLDQGKSPFDAVKELKRRHIELRFPKHKEFVKWLAT